MSEIKSRVLVSASQIEIPARSMASRWLKPVVALLAFALAGCAVDLAKKPPTYFSLNAAVRIKDQSYAIGFTWYQHDIIVWDEGSGVHPAWASSAFSVLRILDKNYAVAIRLPSGKEGRSLYFHPHVVLINRNDLSVIQEFGGFADVVPKRNNYGAFSIEKYEIKQSPIAFPAQGMTDEELELRKKIDEGDYATLLAQSYSCEQWKDSDELSAMLRPLDKLTFFGRRGPATVNPSYATFGKFHGRSLLLKNPPWISSFVPSGEIWIPGVSEGALTYRRGFGTEERGTAPILVKYDGETFNVRNQELFFDPKEQRIVAVWPAGFSKLSVGEFHEAEKP